MGFWHPHVERIFRRGHGFDNGELLLSLISILGSLSAYYACSPVIFVVGEFE
jgi:hypothetical protein